MTLGNGVGWLAFLYATRFISGMGIGREYAAVNSAIDELGEVLHEIFPMEVRAKAIAVFFAIAQCFRPTAPVVYGSLIGDGSGPSKLFYGYLMGGAIMVVGGIVALVYGVNAEGQSLVDVATALNASRHGTIRAEGAGSPSAT